MGNVVQSEEPLHFRTTDQRPEEGGRAKKGGHASHATPRQAARTEEYRRKALEESVNLSWVEEGEERRALEAERGRRGEERVL